MKSLRIALVHFCPLALFCLVSCSSHNVKNSENPEEIYNGVLKELADDDYIETKELIDELRRRFPQSRFAALAEVRAGDLEFNQENYAEAAAAYGAFVELYPNHPEAAYGLYRRALSFFNDAPSKIARDQAPAFQASEVAQQLIKRHPNSEYAAQARELHEKARLRLAQKEAYVARFYERKDYKLAAYRRWRGIEKNYTDLTEMKDNREAHELYKKAVEQAAKLANQVSEPAASAGESGS